MRRHRQLRARPLPSQQMALQAAEPRRVQADALLTRCRELWLHGRWKELVDALELDDLGPHAHRDRLALMLASAHMALGALGEAQRCVAQARQWGAEPLLLARVLLAGVHNTLGRAAALSGQFERAWQHFALAAGPAAGARARTLGLQTRGRQQLQQLGLQAQPAAPAPPPLAAPLQALSRQAEALQQDLHQQGAQLQALHGQWQGELQHGLQALERLQALREALAACGMPAGWPVQATDAPRALAALHGLQGLRFDAVLHWGAGPLTPLLVQALAHAEAPPLQAQWLGGAEALDAARRSLARLPAGEAVALACGADAADLLPALRQLAARLGGWQAPRLLLVALDGRPPAGLPWLLWQQLQPAALSVLLADADADADAAPLPGRSPERSALDAGLSLLSWRP